MEKIKLGNILVEVDRKDIRNVHLSVHPPAGHVRIAAPLRMNTERIRIYAITKLGWIKKQQIKIQSQAREVAKDYTTRESHYFLGRRHLLQVLEVNEAPKIELRSNKMLMYVRPGSSKARRKEVMEDWYRSSLKSLASRMVCSWMKRLNVPQPIITIRKMRTKWGSCNPETRRILINLELAKKPSHCIEYILVHEMAHLVERHHNKRFIALLNKHLPEWRHVRKELNEMEVPGF